MRGHPLVPGSLGVRTRDLGRGLPLAGSVVLVSVLLFSFPLIAQGDAVVGEVYPLRQPDGSYVDVRVWGDEFYRVLESLDGYTLTPDPKSEAACYARLSPDGNELISTGVPVGPTVPDDLDLVPHIRINAAAASALAAAARAEFAKQEAEVHSGMRTTSRSDAPCVGEVQGILLLVDFPDEVATIPALDFEGYCNEVGYTGYGNNGSVRDYFYDVSDGVLTYTNFVPTAYCRALNDRTYYEDRDIPYGVRARELIIEALTDLDNSGFDFSQYDSNGDGVIDAVNCFYAGTRHPYWAEGLWPHSGAVYFQADGVETYRYQITDIGGSLALRTFCHENGHMICYWPDLYDYGYESAGVGQFCLMCFGTSPTNPQEPCAYMKYIAGWSDTTVLTTPQAGIPVPSGVNTLYKYEHPTKDYEYYLVENRQQSGRDVGLPDAGLAIWHVDTRGSNNNEQMTPESHYLVTLVQADGNWDLENYNNYGDATDLWSAPTYDECGPTTYPNTNWWDGSGSSLVVGDISTSAETMTFSFNLDCNANGVPDAQDISGGTSLDCNTDIVPDECQLDGNDCNGNVIPDDCDIAGDTSDDCNSNGVPDECDTTGGGVLVNEGFESGLPGGWSTSGNFQITGQCGTAHPACGGTQWAYVGNTATCSYGDYAMDELVLPPVTLGYGLSELRFCSRLETETNWDWGSVLVDGTLMWRESGGNAEWEERYVDLRPFAGQTVTITLQFTSDSNTSGWLGWQVDNIRVTSGVPDCNGNDTPDDCDISGKTSEDCQLNGIPDECDLSAGTSQDLNTNGVPDECDEAPLPEDSLGIGCTEDDDCDGEARCVRGVCYAPKHRYISVVPGTGTWLNKARRLRLQGGQVLGWVGEPYYEEPTSQHAGMWLADVAGAPVYVEPWPDLLHVTGCEIVADQTYLVQAIPLGQDIGNEDNYSAPVALHTPSVWGDTVGTCAGNQCTPADGIPGLADIMAAITKYQGVDVAPITWLDIDPSSGSQTPNRVIGIGDILKCIDGFQGQPYPGLGPLGCP